MRLKSIKFIEFEGQPDEWQFDCTLGQINLIVGRNATGKSRMLKVIIDLAQLLSGQQNISSHGSTQLLSSQVEINTFMNFDAIFNHEGENIEYSLKIRNHKITHEQLIENGTPLLQREVNGIGKIWSEKSQEMIDFQPPENILAIVNRRDAIQHPFLEKYYHWATNRHDFAFSTSMGRDAISDLKVNSLSLGNVVAVFAKGEQDFGLEFLNLIKSDMQTIGYSIESISTLAIVVNPRNQQPLYSLIIQEKGLSTPVIQLNISNGMFRALSLLIQVNYLLLAGQPSCIIIDDIGEGLDFSRSTQLIKLLIEKVQGSQIQLIMSTNDQFVMDAVPLEYWQIIQREGNQLKIYNYHNSKAIFDKFEFTGLGNFDFFTSNYFLRTTPVA